MTTPGDPEPTAPAVDQVWLEPVTYLWAPERTEVTLDRWARPPEKIVRTRTKEEFAAFYRDRLPALVVFLRYLGARREDALDVAQETMRKAWQGWDEIDDPPAWCRVVASRDFCDRATSREARNSSLDELDRRGRGPSPLASAEALEEVESRHDLLRLIADLPPRQRQVLAWTYNGAAPREIADALGMRSSSVRSTLRHARAALRGRAPREGT